MILYIQHTLVLVSLLFAISVCKGQDSLHNERNNKIVFLLDVSNSMGADNKMQLLRKSTEELLKLLDNKDQVSLLSFGTQVNLLYSTTSFSKPDSLLKSISRVKTTASSTNINGAIYTAYDILLQKTKSELKAKRTVVSPYDRNILLVTDGIFDLNPYTKNLVCEHPEINLTCVIVGRGIEADKAVTYIREELQLKVITLVDEERDVKKLALLFEHR
ncbi:MAG TPA: vWA domain-containing protein [Chitinophagaceae bacterium]|nr:vWA domain-containing protein [Chitinophagaceae bacterium]